MDTATETLDLFHVTRRDRPGWDEPREFVVAAPSAHRAKAVIVARLGAYRTGKATRIGTARLGTPEGIIVEAWNSA